MFLDRLITVDEKCFSWASQRSGSKGTTRKLCFASARASDARNCEVTFGHVHIADTKREITVKNLYEGYSRIEKTLRLKNIRNIRNIRNSESQTTKTNRELWRFIKAQCEKRED